ncbi:dynein regulator [Vararia minispora EC-137]|uniref:Dynein regulator n=1 Tax=Vararia minispora EC-137 TaxID=1314806 RepID=A0ACB8QBS6_9AGAM|nr:dynein regulator [Vararia minispora EC-137]
MSASLSERQQDDLHKAILDYLSSAGFEHTFVEFKKEANLADFQPDLGQKSNGLLVKKWTSVIRMQKKILDLETRLQEALHDNATAAVLPAGFSRRNNPDWLPTASSSRHTLTGHRDAVNAVAFHPVYSALVSASDDATLKVWDWETGELERTLKGHTKRVTDCEFDSKGKSLVSASYDLFIKLWNVENDYQNFATLRGHEHSVSSARFLPGDDRIVSSSRDQSVRIWEIATTHCVKVIRPHSDWVRCAIPSLDGKYVVTCSMDHTAHVVEINSGTTKAELRGHDNVVEAAVFVPKASVPALRELTGQKGPAITDTISVAHVVTASRDKTIKIWDAIRGQCLHTLVGHDDWVRALVFHPNGKYLLSSSDDHTIRIWELKTGRCIRKIEAHERFVACLAWGRQALSSAGDGNEGPTLMNVIASGSSDQTVKVWIP